MSLPSTRPVLIMAGGTGGHVFPALAVARELMARGVPVAWLGSHHGMEARLVSQAEIPFHPIRIRGLRGKGKLSWGLAPFKLMLAVAQALGIIARLRPRAALGMGGFASGPGGLSAWLLHCPLVLHEQNAAAGLTNRLLAPLARRVLCAFPSAFAKSGRSAKLVGNPVRQEIVQLAPPQQRLAERTGPLRVLILGGSQGAVALNALVPLALRILDNALPWEVWHQCGAGRGEVTQQAYANIAQTCRVDEFITDMASAYAWADLVVCRAGALTIAELTAAGVASVLIPFPQAVDDHQTRNAEYLVQAGAAVLLPQHQTNEQILASSLRELLLDRSKLREMACAARRLVKPGAAADVADELMSFSEDK